MSETSLASVDLAPLLERLSVANSRFSARYPGISMLRQPVHTLYGGAHLYTPGAAEKITRLAQQHFALYAPDFEVMAGALGITDDDEIAKRVFDRVHDKLANEAIEDHRVDFEDGYGSRTDGEEDAHAIAAAGAMAAGMADGTLPRQVGIRVKALTEEARDRSVRTLDLFLTTLTGHGRGLPDLFTVTLPKVTSAEQVSVLADCLDLLESKLSLPAGSVRLELMVETIQSILDEDGRIALLRQVQAGRGRVKTCILGTFDYTASCNIASTYQDHRHPAADFARNMMQVALTGTDVTLCDGITNVMPIAPHKPADGQALSDAQLAENRKTVHDAWRVHFDNIGHSLRLGFYQGWDLNPAQVPVRYAAVYHFFLTGLAASTARLRTFIDKAAQASMTGNTFDDAATGQGLVNFFVSGLNCGALTEAEVQQAGLSLAELETRSFLRIVEGRLKS